MLSSRCHRLLLSSLALLGLACTIPLFTSSRVNRVQADPEIIGQGNRVDTNINQIWPWLITAMVLGGFGLLGVKIIMRHENKVQSKALTNGSARRNGNVGH